MVRPWRGLPRTLRSLLNYQLMLLMKRTLETLAAYLNKRAEQALILGLVLRKRDKSETASASKLLLANILATRRRSLIHVHDLLPALLNPFFYLCVLVLLCDQL